MNIYNPYVRAELELYHHGIAGQKWGKRNGPPYPLGSGDHSASEKKAGWRKSLDRDGKTDKVKKQSTFGALIGTEKLNRYDQVRSERTREYLNQEDRTNKAKNKYNKKVEKYGKDSRKAKKALKTLNKEEKRSKKLAFRVEKVENDTKKVLRKLRASGYSINSKEITRYASNGSEWYARRATKGLHGGSVGSMTMFELDYNLGKHAKQTGTYYRVTKNKQKR